MKKNILCAALLGLLAIGPLQAQEVWLNPVPQEYTGGQDNIDIPTQYCLQTDYNEALSPAIDLLHKLMPGEKEEAAFRICIGIKGDEAVRKYARHIPEKAEGYYLKIDKKGIAIAAADTRGAYYGVQTLAPLLALPRLPQVEVTDEMVEKDQGMKISEIFEKYGEEYFRDIESKVIRQAAAYSSAIIATGGGAVMREENIKALKMNGEIFFRDRDPEKLTPTADRPKAYNRDDIRK